MTAPRIVVLNPNRSAWMTERVVARVRAIAGAAVRVQGHTCDDGPAVIDGAESFEAGASAAQRATPALLAEAPGGLLLACFGDPGLEALRAAAKPRPVQGLASAAMALAVSRGLRFAILTCGPAWAPLLRERAEQFGCRPWLVAVHTLPINGAQLARDPARWQAALQAAADEAAEQGAHALILGGAVFAGLGSLVRTPLAVIDSVEAATHALLQPAATR